MSGQVLPKITIVIPSNRRESLASFFREWGSRLGEHTVIVVEDGPNKSFDLPRGGNIHHYSWEDISRDLGAYSWIIPRRNAAIRSYGFYKAYATKADMIITLDDDCYPEDADFFESHWRSLNTPKSLSWFQHFPGIRVRGLPYHLEYVSTVLNMGLWSNIPDLDGKTQIANPDYRSQSMQFNYHAPEGYFLPISSMNVAFRPEVIPAYYFLLMGKEHGYERFDDIWAGIFLKKICDHLRVAMSGGSPYVRHDRASDPMANFEKEKTGIELNELLWRDVQVMRLQGKNFKECYISLATQIREYSPYWKKIKEAMIVWANLF